MRVAMISLHTNPIAQPGTGDAGGMNVYLLQSALALADLGVSVDLFTRVPDTSPQSMEVLETKLRAAPVQETTKSTGIVRLWEIPAGPAQLAKEQLDSVVPEFVATVAAIVDQNEQPDVIHSHYWLSGLAGLALAQAWNAPLVHSMHTMGRVKNAWLAPGDVSEPEPRLRAEALIARQAQALVVASSREGQDLVHYYAADPRRVFRVAPGVDQEIFTPAGGRTPAREQLGLDRHAQIVLFVGRIQKLKAPDVLIRALELLPMGVSLVVVGGPSGNPSAIEDLRRLSERLGVADRVTFQEPVPAPELAQWYRAADLVAVPSYTESFGFVAAEAIACGTPVVGASVGGLKEIIDDGETGLLVASHDPGDWAAAIEQVLGDPELGARLTAGALREGKRYSWQRTAEQLFAIYRDVVDQRR
ncbi:MAG: glycosyltransferase [Promicromonosporaceae bacterium]|nr:glycosyltransferase [Promicromonosporaceae bacterium]